MIRVHQSPRSVVAVVALLALLGCSKGSSPAAAESATVAEDVVPAPPASARPSMDASASSPATAGSAGLAEEAAPRSSVKLLDAGHEPRRALRYSWRAGQMEQMAVVLRTAVTAEAGDQRRDVPLPAMRILLAIDPEAVSPQGDMRFAWHVSGADVEADAGAANDVAQGLSAQLVPVAHLSGAGVVTSRGLTRGVTVDADTAGDAAPDAAMIVQVLQMLRDVAAPLPEEPVGKGARWQKLSSLDAKSGHATQTDTFTLVEMQGNQGALDDLVAQTVSPQALPPLVGVASATAARVDSVLMSGSSKTRFDLTRLVPQTTLDATTSMAVSERSNRMNMLMRLGVSTSGSLR